MYLTPREIDVVAAILDGYTARKEIARLLRIREATVKAHLYRIKQKTRVRKAGLPWWVKQNIST